MPRWWRRRDSARGQHLPWQGRRRGWAQGSGAWSGRCARRTCRRARPRSTPAGCWRAGSDWRSVATVEGWSNGTLARGSLSRHGGRIARRRPRVPRPRSLSRRRRAYAVLGLESVRVGPGARVQPGAVGATAGSVRLAAARGGSRAASSPTRCASRARPGRTAVLPARIGRRVRPRRGRRSRRRGWRPGSRLPRAHHPVVDPALLAPVAVTPGARDLVVPPRTGSAPVAAGAFGAVTVGRGGLLQLAGGDVPGALDPPRAGGAPGVPRRVPHRRRRERAPRTPGAARSRARARPGQPRAGRHRGRGRRRVRLPRPVGTASWRRRSSLPPATSCSGRGGDYRGAYVGRSVTVRPRGRVREDSAFPPPAR